MPSTISLAFSTCPNDTFMFDAWVNGRLDSDDLRLETRLADIHELNRMAMAGEADVIKVSYNAYARLMDRYDLLDAGSALGFGCGPLLIAKPGTSLQDIIAGNRKIAIPGRYTTANLLLSFFAPAHTNREEMLFHEVMPAVESGRGDAGLIIHENRFTYADHGLISLQDLGEFWEQKTGLPIPLGAIIVRKNLPADIKQTIAEKMRQSVGYAFSHPDASRTYVCEHAKEMDPEVMQSHIRLYVNAFSLSLGDQGLAAVRRLLQEGESAGLFETGTASRFQGSLSKEGALQ